MRAEADLCCYWFEKARAHIASGKCKRAGLLATQGIRGGASRETLKRVLDSGGIFFAESDRPWVLDGANVHISMVGFDDGAHAERSLDGQPVAAIASNLAQSSADTTLAVPLRANRAIGFMGVTPAGPFGVTSSQATPWFCAPNPHAKPNSDVVRPSMNGAAITSRSPDGWIVDLHECAHEGEAACYEAPFALVDQTVRPVRTGYRTGGHDFWRFEAPRPGRRSALGPLPRYLSTPTVSKHRLFAWFEAPTLPDHQLIVFARSDDFFFGILHSRLHELWARAQGTQLREKESGFRYTPTTCFETFPFPEPTPEQEAAIAEAARQLDALRTAWLNPPEWTREEVLEFPGSADGPWARYVHDPDPRGVGTVRWPRTVPKDNVCAALLAKRTLTNLYNQRPAWLANAHATLDEAVATAYGWPPDLPDDDIIARLLELNLARAAAEGG